MHRLRRYDVFRFAQNDVAPLRFAMMRCLLQNVAKPRIIREANIIRRSRHHLPKANIIQKTHLCLCRQKCVFCWCGKRDRWTYFAALNSAFANANAPVPLKRWRVCTIRFPNEKKGNRKCDCLFSGAGNGTWTRTVWTTRPSNVRVCQFRHSRVCVLHATYYIIHDFFKMSSLFSKKMKIFSKKV